MLDLGERHQEFAAQLLDLLKLCSLLHSFPPKIGTGREKHGVRLEGVET